MHEIAHESLHALLHVDRSVLSLTRELVLRPGCVAREYVSGRRRRYYGPFAFLVICVAVGSAAIALSGFAAVTANGPSAIAEFLQHHVNLIFFFQVPVIAAACRLLTPRGPFNYAEYLVLAAYTSAIHTLFYMVVDVGGWYVLRPSATIGKAAYFILLPTWPLYFAWACTQFLSGSKWVAAAKGLIACTITYAVMQGTVTGVGALSQLLGAG